jgi:hypothetical protein
VTVNDSETPKLREALKTGSVEEADIAMSRLLDVATPEMLDPEDLVAALDAMERLGEPAQARMFESFILFASQFPEISVPVLTECLRRSPLNWSGRLSASVIYELLEHLPGTLGLLKASQAADALVAAVNAAVDARADPPAEIIAALRAWAAREPLPEAGEAIAKWLLQTAEQDSAKEYFIRQGREILEKNQQAELLSQVRELAATLPVGHALRVALT